jgi:long-chain acyl-CoA synthetase
VIGGRGVHPANRVNFGYLAAKNGLYRKDEVFLVDGDRRLTFRDFSGRTAALARGLIERGLEPGQRVAVLAHNSIELLEVYFAATRAGGVAVPVNVRLSRREVSDILADADPALVIAHHSYLDRLDRDRPGFYDLAVIDGEAGPEAGYESLLAGEAEPPEPDNDPDDVAILIYTSGTTGRPKGVMLTHANLLCDAWATAVTRVLDPDEVALVTAPLYQSGALGSMLGNILKGNRIVLHESFDPVRVLETIEQERVTTALFVPAMLIKLLDCPEIDRFDLSSMRTVVYGAAPMPVAVLKEAMARFGWQFMGACGATETGPAYIACLDRSDHVLDGSPQREKRLGSIGREGINAQVRIVDAEDRPVPTGEVGEIVVRGPHVMKGYWRQPEETARALRNGWYHTEDLGYMDLDGYIFLVDRQKDMIISGGFNVYPREIERALAEHGAVNESAVIGVPHDQWGETPRAYVVLAPGAVAPDEEDLMIFLRERLAGYKLPRGGFRFVQQLPRNASGKLLKRVLRDEARGGVS